MLHDLILGFFLCRELFTPTYEVNSNRENKASDYVHCSYCLPELHQPVVTSTIQ